MKANYNIEDLLSRCEIDKVGDITIYKLDGIRYIDKPGILISNMQQSIDYEENLIFKMDKVEIILKQLGLNQTDLAAELGLTRKAITKYKSQTDDPRTSTVAGIRKALYKLTEKRSHGKLFLSMNIEELFY